jgi:hypothetical protein
MVLALCSLDKGDFRESEGWGHKSEQAMPPSAIQPFSCLAKAGGRAEPLIRAYTQKNHPVRTKAMSLASENQCASETLRDEYVLCNFHTAREPSIRRHANGFAIT